MRLSDDIPDVTNGKLLNEIINESLKYAPRNYVLIGVKSKEAMGASGYDAALAAMFSPKRPTQNTLRKAYINYWHRKELSTGKLKDIAFRMRHTLFVAMESYRKINAGGELKSPPTDEKASKLVAAPEVVIPILPPKEPAVIPILPKEVEIKYAPMAELAAQIVGKLNRAQVSRPTASSILKYGLKQNEHTGKWTSSLLTSVVEEHAWVFADHTRFIDRQRVHCPGVALQWNRYTVVEVSNKRD